MWEWGGPQITPDQPDQKKWLDYPKELLDSHPPKKRSVSQQPWYSCKLSSGSANAIYGVLLRLPEPGKLFHINHKEQVESFHCNCKWWVTLRGREAKSQWNYTVWIASPEWICPVRAARTCEIVPLESQLPSEIIGWLVQVPVKLFNCNCKWWVKLRGKKHKSQWNSAITITIAKWKYYIQIAIFSEIIPLQLQMVSEIGRQEAQDPVKLYCLNCKSWVKLVSRKHNI